jgi:hypothetical protein
MGKSMFSMLCGVAKRLVHFLSIVFRGLRLVLARLWDCRISVLSVVAGIAFFALSAEVRDLFLEPAGFAALLTYAAIVLLFWAIPVNHSAALALRAVSRPQAPSEGTGDAKVEGMNTFAVRVDIALPILLGLCPLVIVLCSLHLTGSAITACENISTREQLLACQGVVHVQDLARLSEGHALSGYATSLEEAADAVRQLRWAQVAMILAILAYASYVYATRHLNIFGWKRRRVVEQGSLTQQYLPLAYAVSSVALFVWLIAFPFHFTEVFGRATLLPILLGGALPLLTCLSVLSRTVKWPVLASLAVVILAASSFATRFHDVRLYKTAHWHAAQPNEFDRNTQRQLFLDDAVDGWMQANECAGRSALCPPMFLIAAEGGASRAAFFVATVIGALLDETASKPKDYYDFRRSLFLMSGVSGGAVGIAQARTALSESKGGDPPCRASDALWFGANERYANDPKRDPHKSWRACLQLLAAGDYLSPTFVGAVLRDLLVVPTSTNGDALFPDRAVLLEQAIERQYNRVVHGTASACGGAEDERGLCHAFGYLPPSVPQQWLPLLLLNATSRETGRPVLLSDLQTAVTRRGTGCPDLFTTAHNAFELFASYPFSQSEPPADAVGCTWPGLNEASDMRLSTAAVLSARFPVISPAGALRYESENRDIVTAHLVDGGYFDNIGLETIIQMLRALSDRGLKTVVLYITNNPMFERPTDLPGRRIATLRARALLTNLIEPEKSYGDYLVPSLSEAFDSLYKTRTGHAEQALEQLYDLESDNVAVIPLRVMRSVVQSPGIGKAAALCLNRPSTTVTSAGTLYQPIMNWWLSPIAQRALDAQLCGYEDQWPLDLALKQLERQHNPH